MQKRINIYIYLLIALLGMTSCSINARIKKADRKYNIGEYYVASEMYRQIYRRISTKDKALRADIAFKQAESQRILNNPRALSAYKNAIKYHYPDSIVFLHYAQALQYQGKYKDAEKQYDIYLQTYPKDYVALAGKYSCRQVETWKKQPSRYKITPAKEFNAKRCSNMAPVFVGEDGDALIFTSNRVERTKGKNSKQKTQHGSSVTGAPLFNIYTARKNAAGKWEEIELCEAVVF